MTTLTLTLDACCPGLGHWTAAIARDGQAVAAVPIDWAELQAPLDEDDLERLTRLVLRARCAGQPIQALGDLMQNGVTL